MNDRIKNIANRIYNTAINEGVNPLVSSFIVSQSGHETFGFSSMLFQRANNAFGMTVPNKRKSPYILGADKKQPDGNSIYAKYSDIEDSVKDLIHWFKYNKINLNDIKTLDEYATILKSKGYYGANYNVYINGMKLYFNQFVSFLKQNNLPIMFLIGILLLFIFLNN